MTTFFLPFLTAALTGILSGWGVGGGTLLLVCMTLFLGVEHRMAQTINLLFFLPTAAASLFFHRKNGRLDKKVWLRAALPGVLAAIATAWLTLTVDVSLLRKPFGLFLLYSGGSMLLSARKSRTHRSSDDSSY